MNGSFHRLRFLLPLALVPGLAHCSDGTSAVENRNLLLITIDTLRPDHLGTYGYPSATSPNIDAFAATATVFDNAHSHASWTLESLATLVTSLYASTHGCRRYGSRLDQSFVTLPEVLGSQGFVTAAVTNHVFLSARHGMDQGIDDFDDELVFKPEEHERGVAFEKSHEAITSDRVSDKGIAWLRREREQGESDRWMLWLHYFDPHQDYNPHEGFTEPFADGSNQGLYDGEIAFTDHHIGRVLAELRALGLDDETLVVIVADHGEEFEEHGGTGHGWSLFAEVLRVPLMIRSPGIAAGRIAEAVRMIDVLPTILELLGVPTPPAAEGWSLVTAMRGGERLADAAILGELRLRKGHYADSLQAGHWKLILDIDRSVDPETGKLRPGARAADGMPPSPTPLLYDLQVDAAEQSDVAASHPDVVARLRRRLRDMVDRARALRDGHGYTIADPLHLSADELEQLRELGYVR